MRYRRLASRGVWLRCAECYSAVTVSLLQRLIDLTATRKRFALKHRDELGVRWLSAWWFLSFDSLRRADALGLTPTVSGSWQQRPVSYLNLL